MAPYELLTLKPGFSFFKVFFWFDNCRFEVCTAFHLPPTTSPTTGIRRANGLDVESLTFFFSCTHHHNHCTLSDFLKHLDYCLPHCSAVFHPFQTKSGGNFYLFCGFCTRTTTTKKKIHDLSPDVLKVTGLHGELFRGSAGCCRLQLIIVRVSLAIKIKMILKALIHINILLFSPCFDLTASCPHTQYIHRTNLISVTLFVLVRHDPEENGIRSHQIIIIFIFPLKVLYLSFCCFHPPNQVRSLVVSAGFSRWPCMAAWSRVTF